MQGEWVVVVLEIGDEVEVEAEVEAELRFVADSDEQVEEQGER